MICKSVNIHTVLMRQKMQNELEIGQVFYIVVQIYLFFCQVVRHRLYNCCRITCCDELRCEIMLENDFQNNKQPIKSNPSNPLSTIWVILKVSGIIFVDASPACWVWGFWKSLTSPLTFSLRLKTNTCHVFHACNHGYYKDEGNISSPASDVILLYALLIGTRRLLQNFMAWQKENMLRPCLTHSKIYIGIFVPCHHSHSKYVQT